MTTMKDCFIRPLSALALAVIGFIPSLFANPVERSAIPEDPAWVLHLDLDALRATTLGEYILAEMRKPEEEPRYAVLQALLGFDPRTGLRGITAYGSTSSPEDGVAMVYGDRRGRQRTAPDLRAQD